MKKKTSLVPRTASARQGKRQPIQGIRERWIPIPSVWALLSGGYVVSIWRFSRTLSDSYQTAVQEFDQVRNRGQNSCEKQGQKCIFFPTT